MELTNTFLMSLAFVFCLMWWRKPQSTEKIYDFGRTSTVLSHAYIRIQIRVDKRVIHCYISFMPYSCIGFSVPIRYPCPTAATTSMTTCWIRWVSRYLYVVCYIVNNFVDMLRSLHTMPFHLEIPLTGENNYLFCSS